MTRPTRYLFVMLAFMAAVAAILFPFRHKLFEFYEANPYLNAVILIVLFLGACYSLFQVWRLFPETAWIKNYRRDAPPPAEGPRLLAPLATILGERTGKRLRMTASVMRSLLDGIGIRLDEAREISRYLIALLVFLGLLGTFWGLLETVSSVVKVIDGLSLTPGADPSATFEKFKRGLLDTLQNAGVAFSTSLFGLGGSLILGFLDLQAGQAQNRFYTDLEDWLSGMTRITALPTDADGDSFESLSSYLQALLEHTATTMEDVQQTLQSGEAERAQATKNLEALVDRLGLLTDQMRTEQSLLARLAESQIEMKPILARLADEQAFGRQELINQLRQEFRALTNRLTEAQLEMRPYLQRMVEDNSAGQQAFVRELRSEFQRLAAVLGGRTMERPAPVDGPSRRPRTETPRTE